MSLDKAFCNKNSKTRLEKSQERAFRFMFEDITITNYELLNIRAKVKQGKKLDACVTWLLNILKYYVNFYHHVHTI